MSEYEWEEVLIEILLLKGKTTVIIDDRNEIQNLLRNVSRDFYHVLKAQSKRNGRNVLVCCGMFTSKRLCLS